VALGKEPDEEQRSMANPGSKKAASDAEAARSKIEEMPSPDRELARRIHDLVTTAAPELAPRVWYGQPAYAKDGKVVCFFRSGQVDKERYSTFGFSQEANLDQEGGIWPTAYAVAKLDQAGEETIKELVTRAVR
jgi:hypothetical protein